MKSMTKFANTFERVKTTVPEEATAFFVFSACFGGRGDEFGIFAPTMEELERHWRMVTDIPLDKGRVQKTAIFAQESTTLGKSSTQSEKQ